MMPVVLEIGAIHIYGYGLMLGLAFLMGTWMLALGLRRRDVDPSLAYTITALAIVFGVYGSKVLWLLEHWGALLADPLEVALNPGMTFYGGLVMGTAAIFLYVRSRRVGFASVLDAAAPALMIAYGIGRLGCHLAGDGDYGMPTTLPWGTDYSHGFVPPSRALAIFPDIAARYPGGVVPDNTLLHPTPVYEFLLGVLGCAILRRLDRRQPPGRLFVVYLMLSSTFRFAVEFLRLNPRVALGLTDAQLVSGALFVVAWPGASTWAEGGGGPAASRGDRASCSVGTSCAGGCRCAIRSSWPPSVGCFSVSKSAACRSSRSPTSRKRRS